MQLLPKYFARSIPASAPGFEPLFAPKSHPMVPLIAVTVGATDESALSPTRPEVD
ncbi:MAG: hypothetical protein M3Y05_10745 [Gemmatimonadota bacterium]|nr:hypothetical protein [Gemmatimonadota bacterium]